MLLVAKNEMPLGFFPYDLVPHDLVIDTVFLEIFWQDSTYSHGQFNEILMAETGKLWSKSFFEIWLIFVKHFHNANCLFISTQDTGKFELVHELSRSLGYPLYRFNCTKTMNYEQLQDIFRGMAATGRFDWEREREREREREYQRLVRLLFMV